MSEPLKLPESAEDLPEFLKQSNIHIQSLLNNNQPKEAGGLAQVGLLQIAIFFSLPTPRVIIENSCKHCDELDNTGDMSHTNI